MSLSQPNSFIGCKHLLELYSNISICIDFFEYTRNKLCSLTVVFNIGRKQNFEILSNAEKTSLSSSFSRRERENDITVKLDFENVINDFANAKESQVSVNTFSLKILGVEGGNFCFVPIGNKYVNLAPLTILFLIM